VWVWARIGREHALGAAGFEMSTAQTDARRAIVGAVAQRGDIFVYEVELSYVMAKGGTRRKKEYRLAVVTGVSREGRIRAYRVAGDTSVQKSVPCEISLISVSLVDVPALEAAYVARGEPYTREFESLGAAREFVRPHLRNGS